VTYPFIFVLFFKILNSPPETDSKRLAETLSNSGKGKCTACAHTQTRMCLGGLKACACVHLRVKSSVLIFMVINSAGYLAAGAADQALIESKCVCGEKGRVTWNGSNVFLIELSVCACVRAAPLDQEKLWCLWASQLVANHTKTFNLTHNVSFRLNIYIN